MAAKFFTDLPLDGPDPECVQGYGESALARARVVPAPSQDHSKATPTRNQPVMLQLLARPPVSTCAESPPRAWPRAWLRPDPRAARASTKGRVKQDPTQGMKQGNDIGSQYRSAIYTTTDAQLETAKWSRDKYQGELTPLGFDDITTEITPLGEFYYAEDYHQQYLGKNPHGYDCHANTGIAYPVG